MNSNFVPIDSAPRRFTKAADSGRLKLGAEFAVLGLLFGDIIASQLGRLGRWVEVAGEGSDRAKTNKPIEKEA